MPNKKDLENLNFSAKLIASSEKPEADINTPFKIVDIIFIEGLTNSLIKDFKYLENSSISFLSTNL